MAEPNAEPPQEVGEDSDDSTAFEGGDTDCSLLDPDVVSVSGSEYSLFDAFLEMRWAQGVAEGATFRAWKREEESESSDSGSEMDDSEFSI
jgi:hypothetical protein